MRTGNHRLVQYKKKMWSGKRHAVGLNIQLVSTHDGRLVLTGDPVPGATLDAKAWHDSGLAELFTGRLHAPGGPGVIGDLAYVGTGVLTGRKRRPGQQLSISERELNHAINSRRACVERAIAHLRNWTMLATGYRGLLSRFTANLQLITRLELHHTWT
ncbi:MAG TPA: transposase family protein [Candidatus Limnocylindrales bacterium]